MLSFRLILDIYALFYMVLDSLRVVVDVFEVIVEIFEVVLGGFRSFLVLVLTSNLTFSKSGLKLHTKKTVIAFVIENHRIQNKSNYIHLW